jgi:hypothetical protein
MPTQVVFNPSIRRELICETLPRFGRARRESEGEEIFAEREVGVVKWIALQYGSPLGVHVVDFGEKADLLRGTVVDAATSRFMMDQFRVWRPDDPVAGFAQSQAKIDVIESDREILIEAAEL